MKDPAAVYLGRKGYGNPSQRKGRLMDDPNMHDYGTHYKIDDAEEILKAVELMTSLFSSSEVIAIFSEHAPVWTRDAKAWIEQNAWRLHG